MRGGGRYAVVEDMSFMKYRRLRWAVVIVETVYNKHLLMTVKQKTAGKKIFLYEIIKKC